MPNHEIELILGRQLADHLSIPVFLVDTKGTLLFFNDAAEDLLGLRYEETGALPADEWSMLFKPQDEHGKLLLLDELPLVKTLKQKTPEHGAFWIIGLDGKQHKISVTSFPIIGRPNRFLGAMALFWKSDVS
jgi:PAS domain-containing protein